MARIAENVFILVTVLASMVSWLIAFIGACIFRRALSGGAWWIVVYELLLIIGTCAVLLTNTFAHYRLVILTFLAASIAMLTGQLDYTLPVSNFRYYFHSGAGAYAAGYIILIIVQFLWIIVFGSEQDSYLGRYGPAYYGNTVGIVGTQQRHYQPSQAPYEMTGDKTILTESAAPHGSMNSNHQHFNSYNQQSHIAPNNTMSSPPTHPATAIAQPTNTNTNSHNNNSNNLEYGEKVQALHAYQANPDDPNELSFAKGETLDIFDRNGNWWQARKADGTVGIIPSNYFAPSP